ncbi:MAG: ribonuclease Z [Nitrospirota bacterium]
MKSALIHRLVNGPFEDPSLFVRIARERRAFLFDIGSIVRLGPGDLQKVTDVFVTHTHIDHFIGFDTLLRALLRRELPLRVYGPSNISDCVEGKLRAYTWNLIREYPLRIEVHAVAGEKIVSSEFSAGNRFRRTGNGTGKFYGILLKDPMVTVRAIELDHDIPCLAFSAEEQFHMNVNKVSLREMGLPVGPWLSELKTAVREDYPAETEFVVSGRRYTLDQLRHITLITRGQKISYVTDVSLEEENIRKIIDFVSSSDTLYCEAYFMEQDRDRAFQRFHLTARVAGRIAREAGVKNLVPMHFSPKYRGQEKTPGEEAREAFMASRS